MIHVSVTPLVGSGEGALVEYLSCRTPDLIVLLAEISKSTGRRTPRRIMRSQRSVMVMQQSTISLGSRG